MFEGRERASGRASTMAGLFKKVDQLVYPGRDGKEATDTMSAPERFTVCAVGTHGGTSGYSRMSKVDLLTTMSEEEASNVFQNFFDV